MRRGGLLWGLLLLMGGVIFLLDNLGFLPISALSLFFPGALILIGFWFLLGPLFFRQVLETRSLTIPANGTSEADIKILHGAGGINLTSMSGDSNLLEGTFAGGVEEKIERSGSKTSIKLQVPEIDWLGFPSHSSTDGFKWDLTLNRSTAYALEIKTGASKNQIDLHDLIITEIQMDSGGNDTEVLLPEQAGFTRGDFHFGSARLELHVPANVAAQIKLQGVLLDTSEIDQVRFPKNGELYFSPDYASAANKVEINIEAGMGKVVVH